MKRIKELLKAYFKKKQKAKERQTEKKIKNPKFSEQKKTKTKLFVSK